MRRARDDEIDMEDIDASNIISGSRRKTDLKSAFIFLANGEIQKFLDNHIIKDLFHDANVLLGNFGHGTSVKKMKELWKLYWEGNLYINEVEEEYIEDKCIACNRTRRLKYELYKDQENEFIGIMGTDCYEIKFITLLELVKVCRRLRRKVNEPGFEDIARRKIGEAMIAVREAPIKMQQYYANK